MSRPRILAILPGFIPSTIITVVKPLLRLHQAHHIELDISREFLVHRRSLERADVIVFCRNTTPKYGRFLEWALELNKPVIYDLDDNLLEAPDSTPGSRRNHVPEMRSQTERYLRQADLVRVYSVALREYLEPYNANVLRVDGPLDWSLAPETLPEQDDESVRLVYATSRFEDEIGLMLVRDVRRLLDTYPQAEFIVWGPRFESLVDQPRVRHIPPIFDYDMFFYSFARQGFDVGLAPLPDDLFHRCKSNNKFREYAACGIAGIYSDTEVYRECVIDGVTGLLVGPEEGAWFEAAARLIEDASLRSYIRKKARTYAKKRYNMEKTQCDWLAHIELVLASHRPLFKSTTASGSLDEPDWKQLFPGIRIIATSVGMVSQVFRLGGKAISSLRNQDAYVTVSKLRVHLSGIRHLVLYKIELWRSPLKRRK